MVVANDGDVGGGVVGLGVWVRVLVGMWVGVLDGALVGILSKSFLSVFKILIQLSFISDMITGVQSHFKPKAI